MHVFKKGDSDYQDELNSNFTEVAAGVDSSVSKTGNETVAGIKDFKDGLFSKGNSVLTQKGELVAEYNSTTTAGIQSGSIKFVRYGDFVEVLCNFQNKSTIASNGFIIALIDNNMSPSTSVPVNIGTKYLTVDAANKVIANWGLTAGEWYVGSTCYIAKNKL